MTPGRCTWPPAWRSPAWDCSATNHPPKKWHPYGAGHTIIHDMRGVDAIAVGQVAQAVIAQLGAHSREAGRHDGAGPRRMKLLHVLSTLDPEGGWADGGRPAERTELRGQRARGQVLTLDPRSAPFLADYPLPVHALGPSQGGICLQRGARFPGCAGTQATTRRWSSTACGSTTHSEAGARWQGVAARPISFPRTACWTPGSNRPTPPSM